MTPALPPSPPDFPRPLGVHGAPHVGDPKVATPRPGTRPSSEQRLAPLQPRRPSWREPRVCPLCSAPHLESEECYDEDDAWTPTCALPPHLQGA